MAEDKVIKSGQITFTRLLFLAVAGGVIVVTVALGGVWLPIGYGLLTAAICVLLFLVAIDYRVNLDEIDPQAPLVQTVGNSETASAADGAQGDSPQTRPRRRGGRAAKRRR